MPSAFVLLNSELGGEKDLLVRLKMIEGVKEAFFVYGVYDFVIIVEAETTERLKEIVTNQVRRLDKVKSTLTMMVVG